MAQVREAQLTFALEEEETAHGLGLPEKTGLREVVSPGKPEEVGKVAIDPVDLLHMSEMEISHPKVEEETAALAATVALQAAVCEDAVDAVDSYEVETVELEAREESNACAEAELFG